MENNAKLRPCSRETRPTQQASSWSHRHSTCKESNQVTRTNGTVATSCLARLLLWQLSPLSTCTWLEMAHFELEGLEKIKEEVSGQNRLYITTGNIDLKWGKLLFNPCWFCTFVQWQRNDLPIILMVGLFEQWETEQQQKNPEKRFLKEVINWFAFY